MHVPAYWETQGFRGYNGFGWYRRTFRAASGMRGEHLVLVLGRIDDIDEVYLNGERIGSTGRMSKGVNPEVGGMEYTRLRAYTFPAKILRDGENTIAIRVYDNFMHGGFTKDPWASPHESGFLALSRPSATAGGISGISFETSCRGGSRE